jgi:hypothetical protein
MQEYSERSAYPHPGDFKVMRPEYSELEDGQFQATITIAPFRVAGRSVTRARARRAAPPPTARGRARRRAIAPRLACDPVEPRDDLVRVAEILPEVVDDPDLGRVGDVGVVPGVGFHLHDQREGRGAAGSQRRERAAF